MKKMMVAACAVMFGIVANAASCSWEIRADWVSANGEDPLEVMVYAFDALTYTDVASQLANGNTSILDSSLASGVVNDEGWVKFTGTGISDDGVSPYPNTSVQLIVVDNATGATPEYFYDAGTRDVVIGQAQQSGGAKYVWDDITTGAIGTGDWATVAPEPTSGLLLLIGVAGLALRRRRA